MMQLDPNPSRCRPLPRSVLFTLLALYACNAEGRSVAPMLSGDLEPAESALTDPGDYDQRLHTALIAKAPAASELQFLVIPSFQAETLLSIYPVGDQFEVQVLTPVTQIWVTQGDVASLELREAKKALPAEIAKRLSKVWKQMLGRTRYSDAGPITLDGVAYTFMHYERGAWTGTASNPRQGTRPFVLAAAGEALVAYANAEPAQEQSLLAQVADSLTQLETSLRK